MNDFRYTPFPRSVSDPFAPDIKRHPENQNGGRDTSHCSVSVQVTRLRDPGVRVKWEEETERSYIKVSHIATGSNSVPENLHLKPIVVSVTSPAIGRYPSMTYTSATFVACTIEKLSSARPTVGHIQCRLYWMPAPYRSRASGVVMRLIMMAGNLISGSLTPPFLLVKKSATLSLKWPPARIPIAAPIIAAKKQRPVWYGLNWYAVE